MAGEDNGPERQPGIEDFLGEPTRKLSAWRWLWAGDHRFPIRSHRGVLGRLVVLFKKLLRPLVASPQNDLWERQRVFNLILLERLQQIDDLDLEHRLGHLENSLPTRIGEVVAHNDALFARLDQKLDLYRRQAAELSDRLGGALAVAETAGDAGAGTATDERVGGSRLERLGEATDEQRYLELERRYRGTPEEIAERLAIYLPRLRDAAPVLDLGCGRGEALAVLQEAGIEAAGVDSSSAMVEACRQRGLQASRGDLFEHLAAQAPGSLGAVVSFHVIEHLPVETLDRLVRLAWRALRPGGKLILETPNPLSVVVAARNFWLDPTHRRPVHPHSLELFFRLAGFEPVERLDLRPFPESERLPALAVAELDPAQQPLAEDLNRLRDRLDELLLGHQDYAMVGEKLQA